MTAAWGVLVVLSAGQADGEPTPPPTPPGWVDLAAHPELQGESVVAVNPEGYPEEGPAAEHGPPLLPLAELSTTAPLGSMDAPAYKDKEEEAKEMAALRTVLEKLGLSPDPKKDHCEWRGVTCKHGTVYWIEIDRDPEVTGELAPDVWDLKHLEVLHITGTNLTGQIPAEIGGLKKLRALDLSSNMLHGSLPSELAYMTDLEVLLLSFNMLDGPIPPEVGHLAHLTALNLAGNKLKGPIPAELGLLKKLRYLYLFKNSLNGTLPFQLADLQQLTHLSVMRNALGGTLPKELGQLPRLESLLLSENLFEGALPPQLGCLSKLTQLWANSNLLEGRVPAELGLLDGIEELFLSKNKFTGPLPQSLARLGHLETLLLARNELCAGPDGEAIPWAGCLVSLHTLSMAGNKWKAQPALEPLAPGWTAPADPWQAEALGYRPAPGRQQEPVFETSGTEYSHPDKAWMSVGGKDPDWHNRTLFPPGAEGEIQRGIVGLRSDKGPSDSDWRRFTYHLPFGADQTLTASGEWGDPKAGLGGGPNGHESMREEGQAEFERQAAKQRAKFPAEVSRRRCRAPLLSTPEGEWKDVWAEGTPERKTIRARLQCVSLDPQE